MSLKIRQKKQLSVVADAVRLLNKDAKFIWLSDEGMVWSSDMHPHSTGSIESHNIRTYDADIDLKMKAMDTLTQIRGNT